MKEFFNYPIVVMICTTLIQVMVQNYNNKRKSEKNIEEMMRNTYSETIILMKRTQEDVLDIQNEMFDAFTILNDCFQINNDSEKSFYKTISDFTFVITKLENIQNEVIVQKSFFIENGSSFKFVESWSKNIESVVQTYMQHIEVLRQLQIHFREELDSDDSPKVVSEYQNKARNISYNFAEEMSKLNTKRLKISGNAFHHFNVIKFK